MGKYKLAKNACYLSGITMSISANLSPILFLTFRDMYNLSFTQLGLLVVINYFAQLLVDLIFTGFTKYFNVHKTVRSMPFIVFIGLILYAILPIIFPDMAFLWIVTGTVIFSIASGLGEVLFSPVIAAIPSDNPEREMSKLHSMYAWGVVAVVILSTLFLAAFGRNNWMYLALLWAIIPLVTFMMFLKAELPPMENTGGEQKGVKIFNKGIILCTLCIFFGGAAECTMSQWASGFIENAIGIPKVYGDVMGVALFAALLGAGRTLYSKYGKGIVNILLFGMLGAGACYFVASLSMSPVVGVIACAMTGIFTSMLWPGTLIYLEDNFENVGVTVYALMAAGGDMGASLAPQLLGIVSDKFSLTGFAQKLSMELSISAEQIGMRAGLLVAGLFPVAGVICIMCMKKYFKKQGKIKLK
ncbi:MAG: MFS transporter [Ruminococcaceae bacterium]|nr:MFS transporter [Oscillospiraceae bacterium]